MKKFDKKKRNIQVIKPILYYIGTTTYHLQLTLKV